MKSYSSSGLSLLFLFFLSSSFLLLSALTSAEPALCPQDPIVDSKMKDREFTDEIIMCVLEQGPCNGHLAHNVKRLAPDVFRGLCPRPCDACTQKQVRKAIAFMQNNYPKQFQEMIYKFGGKASKQLVQ